MRVYLAAPLFSQIQRSWNRRFTEALQTRSSDLTIILPQDFRPAGRFNDPKHYSVLFRKCLAEISSSDVVLAILEGSDVDSGTAFEMGIAHAMGKTIVGVRTDYRPGAEHGMNMMCARACRYMVREFAFQEDLETVAEAVTRRLRKIRRAGQ